MNKKDAKKIGKDLTRYVWKYDLDSTDPRIDEMINHIIRDRECRKRYAK